MFPAKPINPLSNLPFSTQEEMKHKQDAAVMHALLTVLQCRLNIVLHV